ncbi:MAG: hypothetical protein AB8H79_04245 [Myxococcota bacterium]
MTSTPVDDATAWGLPHPIASCDACDAMWLVPLEHLGHICTCARGVVRATSSDLPATQIEQVLPLAVDARTAAAMLHDACTPVPFRPPALDPATLMARAHLVWWPRWLLDATAEGEWSSEAGFEETVQSSVEQLEGGTWVSRPQTQTRTRWEPRRGTLDRRVHNGAAAAVADDATHAHLARAARVSPAPFAAAHVHGSWIRLPEVSVDEARPAALSAIRRALATQVQQAVRAQSIREVQLRLHHSDETWTLRLHPIWHVPYTLDGTDYAVFVDGLSGRVRGPLLGSMKRAWKMAGGLGLGAAALLALALVLMAVSIALPPLLLVAAIAGGLALLCGMTASYPPISVWMWNGRIAAQTTADEAE